MFSYDGSLYSVSWHIWRHLYDSMHAAQKPKSKLKFVTLDKESNMGMLWRREEFLRIYSKKDLAEQAQDIEVTVPFKLEVRGHGTTRSSVVLRKSFLGQATSWGHNQWGSTDRTYFSIYMVDRQGRGVPRGERSRSTWAAQKQHWCAQSWCSKVLIWAD